MHDVSFEKIALKQTLLIDTSPSSNFLHHVGMEEEEEEEVSFLFT